jgi:ACR3 family arsenite efflux pump ArsB
MDTFPYESWADAQSAAGAEGYFTMGPGDNAATIVLVAIAFLLMIFVFVWWIRLEDRKLREQAARITTPMTTTEGM